MAAQLSQAEFDERVAEVRARQDKLKEEIAREMKAMQTSFAHVSATNQLARNEFDRSKPGVPDKLPLNSPLRALRKSVGHSVGQSLAAYADNQARDLVAQQERHRDEVEASMAEQGYRVPSRGREARSGRVSLERTFRSTGEQAAAGGGSAAGSGAGSRAGSGAGSRAGSAAAREREEARLALAVAQARKKVLAGSTRKGIKPVRGEHNVDHVDMLMKASKRTEWKTEARAQFGDDEERVQETRAWPGKKHSRKRDGFTMYTEQWIKSKGMMGNKK